MIKNWKHTENRTGKGAIDEKGKEISAAEYDLDRYVEINIIRGQGGRMKQVEGLPKVEGAIIPSDSELLLDVNLNQRHFVLHLEDVHKLDFQFSGDHIAAQSDFY